MPVVLRSLALAGNKFCIHMCRDVIKMRRKCIFRFGQIFWANIDIWSFVCFDAWFMTWKSKYEAALYGNLWQNETFCLIMIQYYLGDCGWVGDQLKAWSKSWIYFMYISTSTCFRFSTSTMFHPKYRLNFFADVPPECRWLSRPYLHNFFAFPPKFAS